MHFEVGPLSILNPNYIFQHKFAPFVENMHKYVPLNYDAIDMFLKVCVLSLICAFLGYVLFEKCIDK